MSEELYLSLIQIENSNNLEFFKLSTPNLKKVTVLDLYHGKDTYKKRTKRTMGQPLHQNLPPFNNMHQGINLIGPNPPRYIKTNQETHIYTFQIQQIITLEYFKKYQLNFEDPAFKQFPQYRFENQSHPNIDEKHHKNAKRLITNLCDQIEKALNGQKTDFEKHNKTEFKPLTLELRKKHKNFLEVMEKIEENYNI